MNEREAEDRALDVFLSDQQDDDPWNLIEPASEPGFYWVRRFWAKVDVRGPDECWPWIAGLRDGKYGAFNLDGKIERSHRVAFFLEHGRWPEPCARHSCDNTLCCNQRHLLEGTQQDNVRDRDERGRRPPPQGEKNHFHQLEEPDVMRLLQLEGSAHHGELAAMFGVSRHAVQKIFSGRTWTHVTGRRHPHPTSRQPKPLHTP